MDHLHKQKPQATCPLCGGTDFADGRLVATPFVAFCQSGRLLPMSVTGRRCQTCGYLLVFAGRPEKSG